jgi:hypothetical protein
MVVLCFAKTGSNPPVCGVHNVPLRVAHSSEILGTIGPQDFNFYVCPVTGYVTNEALRH